MKANKCKGLILLYFTIYHQLTKIEYGKVTLIYQPNCNDIYFSTKNIISINDALIKDRLYYLSSKVE